PRLPPPTSPVCARKVLALLMDVESGSVFLRQTIAPSAVATSRAASPVPADRTRPPAAAPPAPLHQRFALPSPRSNHSEPASPDPGRARPAPAPSGSPARTTAQTDSTPSRQ